MKSLFAKILMFIGYLVFMAGCSHNDTAVPANTMHAQVDSMQFNSSGTDVKAGFPINQDSTKTELVVTGTTGNPSNLTFLLIQILDYDKNNGSGTYAFDSSEATGLYSPGSGVQDFFVNGSVIIAASANTITGTFTATTQSGIKVTNGSFSVVP
jgi:hypothetical protein